MFILSKIDRYVGWQILQVFFVILVVLILVLFGSSLIQILKLTAAGTVSPNALFSLLSIEILRLSGRLFPAAFFFASVLVLTRLYQDQEIIGLFICGKGLIYLIRIVFLVSLPLSIVSAWLILVIYPVGSRVKDLIRYANNDIFFVSMIENEQFYKINNNRIVFYTKFFDTQSRNFGNTFIYELNKDSNIIITIAKRGSYLLNKENNEHIIILFDGYQYLGIPGTVKKTAITEFNKLKIYINIHTFTTSGEQVDINKRDTVLLFKENNIRARAQIQERILYPIFVLTFGLLSVPISHLNIKQLPYGHIIITLILYLIFMVLANSAETWMIMGITPGWIGQWWVIIVMMLIVLVMFLFDRVYYS